jgi:hypothetical protein
MCCSSSHTPSQPYISENKFLDKSKFEVPSEFEQDGIKYVEYKDENDMPLIMNLITKDLSEPYSIYTYRYFIHNWPFLCFLVSEIFLTFFLFILIKNFNRLWTNRNVWAQSCVN